MAMLPHANSRRMYSWWWDSHISPKNSKWLQENLTDMDKNVKAMIKLIEEDADSFRKRAEMYYRKRPELMKLVEEFYRAYRALAERYDHATGALRQAHRTMAEAFPDQIPILLPDESLSGSSGIDSEPQTSKMLPLNDADASKGLRQMNAMFATGEEASPAVFTEASQLSEENQRLKNQIKSETERADNAQVDVDRLKGTISELESDKETVFVQCQLSQEQISGLEAELSRAQEELKKLNDEMLSSISNLKSVEDQCHLLEEGNLRLKNQITSESERAEKAQAYVESLKGTISELESVKEAAFLQCQLSQERISSLEDELSCTQQDMKKLNDEMLSNITNLKSVEEQCHLLEEQNNSLQLELDICKERAKTKQAELDTRQEEVEKLEVSISYEKQRSMQLEIARLALEDLQSQSQEEVRILTLEVQNGAEMLKNTELTKASLEEELQLLKEENAGVEKEKLYLSLKITDLQDEINSLNEAKGRFEDQVQHHVEENGSLKEESFSSSLKIMNLQDEIALLKESKKRLEDDVQLLVEEKKALQLEIISMKEDKALLELRHRELTEKIGAVNLNVESLQVLVKELRDGNLELKEMCKMNEDEKSVHLDNLKRMEKIAEKNDVLEASLSSANVELEGLREKIKELEECCETLQDRISMHISDKAIMVSQIETIAQDMEMLSEKKSLLENSLSDANVELEGMRGKLGSLKETCQSLQVNESNLLSEKSTLVTQVESISRSLENSENTYAELECKNMNLEKEKEHMLRQVTELQASLKMEKEEHETLMQSNKSQLATLEHQICILQEKGCLREEAFEAECDKLISAHLENFILQRCLHDMTEKSLILSDIYEKNLQTSRCKENFILELEKVSIKQNKSLSALSQDNEKFLEGVNRAMEMLNINNNETPSYQHFELILNEIKDLQASISDVQDDKQHLMVEKSIILALLEQSKLDMMNLELEKDGVEREFRVKCEELSVLLCQKQEQMEINEHLRKDVQGCNQREEGLNAEIALVSQKLVDLHEAHSSLQGESSKSLDEKQSLSMKLYDLHHGKETLEEENNVLLQELITLECLCLTFRSYNAERAVNIQLLGNDLEKEIRSMNVKLGIIEIENINLKESVAVLEESKRRLVILEDDVSTSRSVCKELNTQVETEKKLIVQKDMELFQATHNFQVLQDKNSELCRTLEQLMVEIDDAKVVREEFEKKICTLSENKVDKDNEIAFLRQANGTMCGDLDQLHNEVRDLKNRENHLISELQEGIDGAKSCEAELTTLLNESQITTINASVYEEKMLELLLTCESLEISTMVQKEKFYEEVTLRNVFEDELNKKLEALSGENRGLKEELDLYMPLVLSLYDDVASLEECIISPAMHHSLEKQDNRLVCLQHERNDGEKNADYRTMPAGILELQKLQAKLNALQMVLMDHLEHERSVSGGANLQVAMRKFDELNSGTIIGQAKSEVNKGSVLRSKTKGEFGNLQNGDTEKSKESYDQIVKDIQLDYVLSSAQYKDGASSRAPSTIESVETKYELELWDAGDSNKPVASFHDLEYHQIELVEETKKEYPSSKLSFDKLELPNIITRSDQEWSGSVSGRLSFDGQRLLILQMNVKELKRKMETSLLNESPRNVEFEKIKAQLKEREKAISHLMNKNNKLTKKAESFSASPGSLVGEQNDGFGNISERRSERKISERARRASEKIARLELEMQKIQYILLKLKEEDDFRRARVAERKTRVLLKDYLYGRKDSPRRKKVHCCACSRPKTKD